MKKPEQIIFFCNGNTFACDAGGQQIGELQEPWLQCFFSFLESKDVNPEEVIYRLPDDRMIKVIRTEDGYNWEVK